MGAPGSGKGTQARKLWEEFRIPAVSTGDLVRAEIKADSELGKACKPLIAEGKLVPDDIIVAMYKNWVTTHASGSFISDGFPRTLTQAKHFDKFLLTEMGYTIKILFFQVYLETLKKRILGRLTCSSCGNIQNKFFGPPKSEGQCDLCGSKLEERVDDTAEIIQMRYDTYLESTVPILEHYEGKITTINAEESVDKIFQKVKQTLGL
jgi:adenylate kinase